MGYTTDFDGYLETNRPLTIVEKETINDFSDERHEGSKYPGIWCQWIIADDDKLEWDGEDDCGEHYVSKEQLKQLHDLCLKAKDVYENGNKEDLKDLLPSQSGFFFGSTEYGEWYLEDLKTTISILEPIIKLEKDNGNYYYTSSW